MRRRKLPPDTRPDWRDPNMPVYRGYLMSDGRILGYVSPYYEQCYREWRIDCSIDPNYSIDPTYHLNRRKPRS